MDHKALKERQRAERDGYPPNLTLRVHRALSWLDRAEQLQGDPDGQFIFLWIAFNAAYATEIDDRYRLSEQRTFREFLQKLADLGAARGRIEELVWREFPGSIRLLLDNPYVFQDFWSSHNGSMPEEEWKRRFADAKRAAHAALGNRDTVTVLSVVLDQIRDCTSLMGKLVPLVIEIMMDHPQALWGDACYPVVNQG
jgi:hypothetical protein